MLYLVTFGREGAIKGIFLNEKNAMECKRNLERLYTSDIFFISEVESDFTNLSTSDILEDLEKSIKMDKMRRAD